MKVKTLALGSITREAEIEPTLALDSEHEHRFNKLVSRISLTRFSFAAARRQKIWALGQLLV